VQQTSDGGYIIVGSTSSYGGGEADIWLIKIDSDGDTLWSKTFGEIYDDLGFAVQQTDDDGYIITGETYSFGGSHPVVWLIKTDINGDTLWTKTYNGNGFASANSIQQTNDGGYIITGWTGVEYPYDNVLLMKTDASGDSIWTRIYEDNYSSLVEGKFVRQTTDGGYIIVSGPVYPEYWDFIWLIKTDAAGDTLWTKTFLGSPPRERLYCGSVQQTSDGGYIIVGTVTNLPNLSEAILIKTNTNGDTLWTHKYGIDYDWGNSIQQTSDGGFIFTGSRLFRTDPNGQLLWTKDYRGINGGEGNSIQKTEDGGYIIVGDICRTDSVGFLPSDVWLIKMSPDTGVVSIKNLETNVPGKYLLFQNYPNPFNPTTTIEFVLPHSGFVTLKIYNILGEEVATLVSGQLPSGFYQYVWDARRMATGIYMCRLQAGDYVETRKLVLMR